MKSNEEFLALVNEKAEIKKAALSKKNKLVKRVTATALAFAIILSTVLIAAKFSDENDLVFDGIRVEALDESLNLTENLSNENKPKATVSDIDEETASATDFAFDLLRAAYNGDNILISPYSVYMALAMTANGADGKTRAEIEEVLGLTVEEMNNLLSSCQSLHDQYKRGTFDSRKIITSSNSVWFRNDLPSLFVNKYFLENMRTYYNADVFSAPFNDETFVDINDWICEKTENTIPQIIDRIEENDVMYIINAVLFNARWDYQYRDEFIIPEKFYSDNGTVTETEFLRRGSTELIILEKGYGFVDKYKSGFRYLAFLPHEGVSIEDFIASLDAHSFAEALKNENIIYDGANVTLPSYKDEFSAKLKESLQKLGISRAFDSNKADFSGLISTDGEGNVYLGDVIHKTYIDLNNTGTIASGATFVQTLCGGTQVPEQVLNFNRPFVYMIVDENDLPIFIGAFLNYSEENKTVNVRKGN